MKNSLIVEYRANDPFEFITNIFNSTKEMGQKLNISTNCCKSIMSKKQNHKGFKYERIWFKDGESINE